MSRVHLDFTKNLLHQRLLAIRDWYKGMLNRERTWEYEYFPATNRSISRNVPIRNIATLWDIALLQNHLKTSEFNDELEHSLRKYVNMLLEKKETPTSTIIYFDSEPLGESASIAHSTFMMLALMEYPNEFIRGKRRIIEGLADGIVSQQRTNGSMKVFFTAEKDHGEAMYAGEAILGLMFAAKYLKKRIYNKTALRAAAFYRRWYDLGNLNDDIYLVFFANWQAQAHKLIVEQNRNDPEVVRQATEFVFKLHDKIIAARYYERLERYPQQMATVEVACALEGLADAYEMACIVNDKTHQEKYISVIEFPVHYLLDIQAMSLTGPPKGRGGFANSMSIPTQRIDVTGHAMSGFLKLIQYLPEKQMG